MTNKRENLRKQDKEKLIDTVLLLQGRVNELERQVRELKELIGLGSSSEKPAKTPENSSIPSGRSRKAKKKATVKRKRGPKRGHKGKNRRRAKPDEVIDCRVSECADCGEDLSVVRQRQVGQHQVIDIPPMRPIIREARRYEAVCPCCGAKQQAVYPAGFEKGRKLGKTLEKLIVYLHHAHPLSYQRVQHILRDLLGLDLSVGALVNLVKRSRKKLQNVAETIRKQVQQAPIIGSDETGVRIEGDNCWQWVFQTPEWVYIRMHRLRASQVIKDVMDDATPRVWVSDLASVQLCHPADKLQVCLAHQLRDLQYAIDAHRCRWAYHMKSLFHWAMRLVKWRDKIASHHYQQQVAAVERQCDHLMKQYPDHVESRKLRNRYLKHRNSLFVFLHQPHVPPTNNASEQALRNSVIYRKVTGGFRTDWGANLYANVISILETARRQELNFFDVLSSIFSDDPVFDTISE